MLSLLHFLLTKVFAFVISWFTVLPIISEQPNDKTTVQTEKCELTNAFESLPPAQRAPRDVNDSNNNERTVSRTSLFGSPSSPLFRTLRDGVETLRSQSDRLSEDGRLLTSVLESAYNGGMIDDKKYIMERVIELASTLPPGEQLNHLSHSFVKQLWTTLPHPPRSLLGREYQYRTADGSNNNIMCPSLGKAGSHYARSVTPKSFQPNVHPDPNLLFDTLFARGENAKEHPSKVSSMMFYFASLIIHDLFHTDERDHSRVRTSSYLDLAPLYGSNQGEQDKIRTFNDGMLKPDTFSEVRLLGFPPGVAALAICFNRFHNHIAIQLKEINEDGRFPLAVDGKTRRKLDEDLFQTARLITCGLYVNIILTDYVRTILNLNRTASTWSLDPREESSGIFNHERTPLATGNQVSCEFNLAYRWHSTISKKDERWSNDLYQDILGTTDFRNASKNQIGHAMHQWLKLQGVLPEKWNLDNGRYKRTPEGPFRDEDLANILSDATEDVACAFGPRQVPGIMKMFEVLGMEQARHWNVATLNEFRKFFKLQPHKTFNEISSDVDVASALEALYHHPDNVELYPGMVVEDAKAVKEPGSGLCPGFTISQTILSDAVALVRGDRFYTIDYTPANLTNWGFKQIKSDPDVAQGGCMYNLIMRALPNWHRGNSVYAMFPFTVPEENSNILAKLGIAHQYDFSRPSFARYPVTFKTWIGCAAVLQDKRNFRVPWGAHTKYLTGHDYMLSGDEPQNAQTRIEMKQHLYCPVNGLDHIRKFYEAITTQLIENNSNVLRGRHQQLDACRDVSNKAHAVFVAQLFNIPLRQADTLPLATTVDDLHLALSVLFAYVFLDADAARSFKLRKSAKQASDELAKLVKAVCELVKAGKYTGLNHVTSYFRASSILSQYGISLIDRMFEGGKSVDEVVWNIIPTAAAAVATQAQQFTQILDFYISEAYNKHWPDIQKCALSDSDDDFEKLKSYALEACRLAPAAYGLLRNVASNVTMQDGERAIRVRKGETVYTNFVSAGLDPLVFPDPYEIKLDRPRECYIHHGYGSHVCLGKPFVEVAMAAQLRIFARLKNLRRAPGVSGQLKKTTVKTPNPVSSNPVPSPGSIEVFMTEDWSDWWPFPTTLKLHHDGWLGGQQERIEELLRTETGLPGREDALLKRSKVENTKDITARLLSPNLVDERQRGRSVGAALTPVQLQRNFRTNPTTQNGKALPILKRRDTR